MLPQTGGDEQRAVFLDCIRREVARMERLLSEVGEISRLDAGIEEEERLSVELGPLAAGVLQSVRTRAPGAVVRLSAPEDPLRVCGAPTRLAQVLQDLLDNALDFSPPGGPVEVRLERRGSWAALRVEGYGGRVSASNRPEGGARFEVLLPLARRQ